jgi:hypothetical protein
VDARHHQRLNQLQGVIHHIDGSGVCTNARDKPLQRIHNGFQALRCSKVFLGFDFGFLITGPGLLDNVLHQQETGVDDFGLLRMQGRDHGRQIKLGDGPVHFLPP